MRFSVFATFFIIAFSGSVVAADAIQLDVVESDFKQQQNNILKVVSTDVEYGEIADKARTDLRSALARIDEKLMQSPFASLNDEDRKQVLEDQALVNASLVQAKSDSRLVCRREAVLGTNFAKKVCRTTAQLKRENDKVRDEGTAGKVKL